MSSTSAIPVLCGVLVVCLALAALAPMAARAAAAASAPTAEADTKALETYARGDYVGVVKLLEKPYRAGSATIQDHLILARAYMHLGRSDDALGVLRAVLERDRENPEANGLTGQLLYEAGKCQEALEYLETAHRLKQDAVTSSFLGKCHYALGNAQKAKTYLEQALALDVRDPSNSFLLGSICLERGLGALAEKYLLQAQEAGMESVELHRLLGRAYLLQRKLVGPVLVRRIVGEPKPGDVVEGHVVLGPVEGVADQYTVCMRYSALYEGLRLLEADPKAAVAADADGLYMVASSWLEAGDTARAAAHLATLAAAEPASRRVLELAARVQIAALDVAALERTLSTAEKRRVLDERELSSYYYRAALALLATGDRDGALRLLGEAEARAPTSGNVLRALADLSVATGRLDEARTYYARLVELFPDADDIDELRNALQTLEQ